MKTITYNDAMWQLVPKVPTSEQFIAARDWSYNKFGKSIGDDSALGCYDAMLAATPEHPAAGVGADHYDAALNLMAAATQLAAFDAWWDDHGCLVRSGGGEYERSFAWEAWNYATVAAQPVPATPQQAPSTVERAIGVALTIGQVMAAGGPDISGMWEEEKQGLSAAKAVGSFAQGLARQTAPQQAPIGPIEAPTGEPARAWTAAERSNFRAAMQQVADREAAMRERAHSADTALAERQRDILLAVLREAITYIGERRLNQITSTSAVYHAMQAAVAQVEEQT